MQGRDISHLPDSNVRQGEASNLMMLPAHNNDADSSLVLPDQACQRLTFAEIQSATQNFDERLVIGHGGFGKVYKCHLTIASVITEVAIKRLDSKSDQGATEFEAEVKLLSKLRHENLISLIGYCNEGNEMVLVYEFVPNGTIRDHLRKADCALSWLQRLKICTGAARALDYLHTGTSTQQGIIHRDVKTSNILLDANFDAKISDFGLAKIGQINQTRTDVSTRVKGTFGYLDPCYFYSGKLTRKSDVYAFGVVLFEVLSAKQAVDSTLDEDQWSLAAWVQDQIKEGKLNKIIDSRLTGQISKKCLKKFAGIAGQCLHTQPKQRPTMAEVVVRLDSILSHETEFTNSIMDEGRFLDKVRYFFTGKAELTQPASEGGNEPEVDASLRIFTYDEVVSATNDFKYQEPSPTLYETIYKGWVNERKYTPTKRGFGLAIYVTKNHIQASKLYLKGDEFNHPNLVKLLGYCLNKDELYCVFKLLPDERLDKLLFGGTRSSGNSQNLINEQGRNSLSWVARLKIALGAAQGLSFLHQRDDPAYQDFKTAHILVDTDFNARLWDFEVVSSYGFLGKNILFPMGSSCDAPEVIKYQYDRVDGINGLPSSYGIGLKTEIYNFGMVLLEILTGIMAYDVSGLPHLLNYELEDELKIWKIMDPHLQHNNCPSEEAFKLAALISKCLRHVQEKRPSMKEIVQVLYECSHEHEYIMSN